MNKSRTLRWTSAALLALAVIFAAPASADFVINDDLIVDGSACIGFDCVNGESFGFDTIRLKENNLRIKFDDTSVAAAFPRNDWQITANDSANGGLSKFSIDDISGSRTPFTIEANAPSHSLYVDDGGRIGIRTSTPSTDIHVIDGDTPTLRLQQDGSSGFAPQTWDVAGNETNFFIRDVTNGSTLPLRIRPNAPSSSIFIDVDGSVGVGTSSPDAPLEARASSSNIGTGNVVMKAVNPDGAVAIQLDAADDGSFWNISHLDSNDNFQISKSGTGSTELILTTGGDLTLSGNCADAVGGGGCTADYVFEPDYNLMPLDQLAEFVAENQHLPNVPPAEETRREGLNLTAMNGRLLEKIEELTLYTLQQQRTIDQLTNRLEQLEDDPDK